MTARPCSPFRGRHISIQIASAAGREGVQELVYKAFEYYDQIGPDGTNENGKLIKGADVPGNGCAMVYVWPPDHGPVCTCQ